MSLDLILKTRIQKAAQDNGFDISQEISPEIFLFSSTKCNLNIWIASHYNGNQISVGFSDEKIVASLKLEVVIRPLNFPQDAMATITAPDLESLHDILKRSFHLSRSLPNALADFYEDRVKLLPKVTEAERIVVQRIGQDIYRQGLLDYWDSKCAITGFSKTDLLRASHIKPWSQCADSAERLNVFNGLLLSPSLDLAFDQGLISFHTNGDILLSPSLPPEEAFLIGIKTDMHLTRYQPEHEHFMQWHRSQVFQNHS